MYPSLHDVQQFNQEIIDCAAEGIIVCDRELRHQVWNHFMEQLTGGRAEEALGKSAVELFPSLRENAMEAALSRALQGEVVQIPDVLVRMPRTDRDVWESCTFSPHRDSEGNVGVIGMVRDVTERHIAEETFRLIVVGTATSTGTDFFQTLVRHMAAALRARFAFLTACDDQKHARSLAFWKGDGFGEGFEFDITDTPCEKVLHGEVCQYQQGLQGLFPLDKLLADWNAESYLGVPMLDRSNRVIGHIAILDDKPMDADSRAIGLVRIFASRAAAELKRQKAEDGLQAALQEVQRLKDQLYRENLALRDEVDRVSMFEEIVGSSKPLKAVLSRIAKVAPTDSTLFVTGETGTGKELIARAVHMRQRRAHDPAESSPSFDRRRTPGTAPATRTGASRSRTTGGEPGRPGPIRSMPSRLAPARPEKPATAGRLPEAAGATAPPRAATAPRCRRSRDPGSFGRGAWRATGDAARAPRAKTVDTDRQWTAAAARHAGSALPQWRVAPCRDGRSGLVQSCRFSNARRKNSGESVRGFREESSQLTFVVECGGKDRRSGLSGHRSSSTATDRPAFPAGPETELAVQLLPAS